LTAIAMAVLATVAVTLPVAMAAFGVGGCFIGCDGAGLCQWGCQ
jgi:hypothetical protein